MNRKVIFQWLAGIWTVSCILPILELINVMGHVSQTIGKYFISFVAEDVHGL